MKPEKCQIKYSVEFFLKKKSHFNSIYLQIGFRMLGSGSELNYAQVTGSVMQNLCAYC